MYSKLSLACLSNNVISLISEHKLKLTFLSFSQFIFRIEEYVKNGRTAIALNPHDSLLEKQSDGTETGTKNQHCQDSLINMFPAIIGKNLDKVRCKVADKPLYCS